ncbi:MAG: ABC transporter substrate-binding protein [Deltaproteobacteria bacterium]|uniref:ABC transporter substrate-binding protein n=1 Tax=Desulfobacula sp. TaxID=2593537 RepID=UPI0019AAADCB|nr:ABC transporter substrate-binding protein [Candidatus Desulfobacula maris]MBL6995493.1 ABC transporter substrate-binding protein [Desulfobacula sp.]
MNRSIKPIAIGILCLLVVFQMDVCAQEAYETKPLTNNGKKWRIGYFEGGPYANYQSILKAMTASLMDSGWIQHAPIPKCQDENETRTLWNFLSTKIQSDYLEFPSDAYWNHEWNRAERERLKPVIINRLKKDKDIDLMLAFGTWAGQDLANNQHDTPTMVLSVSNAVQSGIIKSVEDSGFDHLQAWIDPEKTERQLRLFHEIIRFKRLGLAYHNNSEGKSYASVEDVLKLSRELDFQVIECQIPAKTDIAHKEAELIRCHERLAPEIDAIYITDYAGLTKKSITKLLSPLFKHKVPMFAQTRYDLVKNGILMGAGRSDFTADASFYVQSFAKILHGAKPGDLPQKFESPLKIVINLESAKKIGFRFPLDILAGAFEIHDTIQNPEDEK